MFTNVLAFLYVKANSEEICEEISFPAFQKMLMSAFLSRFKANSLEKLPGYPNLSLWIPLDLAKIYFFRLVLTWHKSLLYRRPRLYIAARSNWTLTSKVYPTNKKYVFHYGLWSKPRSTSFPETICLLVLVLIKRHVSSGNEIEPRYIQRLYAKSSDKEA